MKKYLYEVKHLILLNVICNLIATIALANIPYLTKRLFDSIESRNLEYLVNIILIYVGCNVLNLIITYIENVVNFKIGIAFEVSLKKDFFKVITNYDYMKFSSKDIGEYISIQANEITQLEMDYLTPAIDIIKSINTFAIYGIMFFAFIDWRIALVVLGASIFSTLIAPNLTAKELSKRRKVYLDKMGIYVSKIKDLLEGFKLIQSKTRKNMFVEQESFLKDAAKARFAYGKFKSLALTVNGGFIYSLHIISFSIVGYLLIKKEITVGTAVATLGYLECFISPMGSLIYDINTIKSTRGIKLKVLEFLKDNEGEKNLIVKKDFNSSIEFKDATVDYDKFSLKDFSYRFEKNKKYAIIGHSGSGKSTIIGALMKYVNLSKGNIYIDGKSIEKLDISYIIHNISQHEHIFTGDYKNNVTVFGAFPFRKIGILEDSLSEVMLDSIVQKSDCQLLSGGEKQVLSIFRMCLADTPICIMDEVFSATDMNITEKLEKVLLSMKDKTMIIITHKLSEHLEEFDEILLIENGKLVQSGTYEDILKSAEYRKLQSA
ncbi:ATP-binding cassette domain-containing protein [Inconstantimicrobium mannanitabidum]|uniref:ABC transporter permease n=1 Tax=Inconstantimicrobium mannanitabidum TaxID=1604901 RepID=A0ACB5RG35_9CLOT|nr:ABC transporter ATP-binding protein [Clostridium sp. TW13]GKX68017.1 ABC transporter permease [Clostridium sp. TW13]